MYCDIRGALTHSQLSVQRSFGARSRRQVPDTFLTFWGRVGLITALCQWPFGFVSSSLGGRFLNQCLVPTHEIETADSELNT